MASARLFCVPGTAGRHSQRGRLQLQSAIKRTSDINVVCVKTMKAQKGKEAAMKKLCDRIQRYTEAQAKDKSKGIMAFNIHEDPYEKGLFHTWEHYKDVLHLGLHNSSDEFVGFMKQVNAVADGTPGIIMYEYRNGHLGAAAQQGGPKGEGGLDDTSGASKTATASSLRQNSKLGDMAHHQKPPKHEEEVWGMGFEVPWLKDVAKGVAGAVRGLTKVD